MELIRTSIVSFGLASLFSLVAALVFGLTIKSLLSGAARLLFCMQKAYNPKIVRFSLYRELYCPCKSNEAIAHAKQDCFTIARNGKFFTRYI